MRIALTSGAVVIGVLAILTLGAWTFMKTSVIALAVAFGLIAIPHTADAKGCITGAVLGAVAGHYTHHTFLGLFGGCAGGMVVHHMYSGWKSKHPNGTMHDFVEENRDRLPQGWAERLEVMAPHNVPSR